MENVSLIVKNATIITMDSETRILEDHSIAVTGSIITAIGPTAAILEKYESSKVIDGRDQFIFPGFINTHTHLFQNGLKGLGRDKLLFDWLDSSVRKALREIRYDDVYNAALAGCIENMRSGVTTVLDYMYAHASQAGLDDAVVKAFEDSGIRGILGRTHTKTDSFPEANRCPVNETEDMFFADIDRLAQKLKGHERITLAIAPGIIWDMGADCLRKVRQYANKYGLRITLHLDESPDDDAFSQQQYGMNTAEFLDQNGILGEDFIGVHLVHLDARTLELMHKRRIKCSHNPVSNLILASGISPVPELKKLGLDVSLGTDAAAKVYFPGFGAYSAAKGGIFSFSNVLSEEVKYQNINVNSVLLGMINTEKTRERIGNDPAVTIALDEMLQPPEVSKVVLFLVSDEAAPIKGAALDVFGNRY